MLLFYLSALEDVCTWHVQGGGGGASTVCYYTKDDKHRLSPLYQPPHPHPSPTPHSDQLFGHKHPSVEPLREEAAKNKGFLAKVR